MAIDVVMPLLGLTMEEGTLVSWIKKEGDSVQKGEAFFEVETDKAVQEVEALVSGFLAKTLIEPGTTLPVGKSIAVVAESQDELKAIQEGKIALEDIISAPADVPAAETAKAAAQPTAPAPGPALSKGARVPVSPAARRLAQQHNVDLQTITGTGPGGRIMQEDVLKAADGAGAAPPDTEAEYQELSAVRRITAQRLAESFQTAPHFYLSSQLDAAALVAYREERLPAFEKEHGLRFTYTDLLLRCLGLTLKDHPLLNAEWADGKVKLNRDFNIGMAVDTEQGLTVPVVRDVDSLSLADTARRRKELVDKAQAGRLALDDFAGGTFTLTNLGMFDVDLPQAIINPPQAAIMATGGIKERAVAWQGKIAARPTMYVTLSVDHRVADGVAAARFLQDFQRLLQDADRLASEA